MRNATLKFICKDVQLRVERNDSIYTRRYQAGAVVRFPIAHKDGSYFADDADARSGSKARAASPSAIATRKGRRRAQANPNGSRNNIAGIYNETGTVLGLMPHPERLADPALSGTDGANMFAALVESLP